MKFYHLIHYCPNLANQKAEHKIEMFVFLYPLLWVIFAHSMLSTQIRNVWVQ